MRVGTACPGLVGYKQGPTGLASVLEDDGADSGYPFRGKLLHTKDEQDTPYAVGSEASCNTHTSTIWGVSGCVPARFLCCRPSSRVAVVRGGGTFQRQGLVTGGRIS